MIGIYIKGMGMPKAGAYFCEIGVLDESTAVLTIFDTFDEPRRSYKLIPVPPHGRLIDADALIIALETQDYSGAPDTLEEWTPMDMTEVEIGDIRNAPTIIPADEEAEQ